MHRPVTTTLVVLLFLSAAFSADAATRLNYVAANFPEDTGDKQGRWNVTVEVPMSSDPLAIFEWLGLPALPIDAELWGAYGVDGVGFMDVESSPVNLDHTPEAFIKVGNTDVGVSHTSTGEDGDESQGQNLLFVRRNVSHRSETLQLDLSVSGFMFIDAENDITREIRAFGDDAKWGLSGIARAIISFDHTEWLELQAEVQENWAFFSVGLLGNPDRLYTPFIYAYTGRGPTLEALDEAERAFGGGASFDLW